MKFSLILTSLLIGTIFIGCGSDDSDSNSSPKDERASIDANNTSRNNDTNLNTGNANRNIGGNNNVNNDTINSNTISIKGVKPVTKNVVCDPEPLTDEKESLDWKYAATGDITIECKNNQYISVAYGEYKLKDNIDSMTITQIKKVEAFEGTIDHVYGYGISTYDYKAGTIHHKVDAEDEKYDCVEKYPSPLLATITDSNSIEELLEDWGNDEDKLLSTTCPQSFYDDDDDDDDNLKGNGKAIINYTITDDNNKNHYISEIITFKSSK
jgi:hypothetical protein